MLKSMTGYASGEKIINGKSFTLEIRALNGRFLDVKQRLSRHYSSWEPSILDLLRHNLQRGRVEVNLMVEPREATQASLKKQLQAVERYLKFFSLIKKKYKIAGDININTFANLREIFEDDIAENPQSEWSIFESFLKSVIVKLIKMQENEGSNLKKDFERRLLTIEKHLKNIEENKMAVNNLLRENIQKRINNFLANQRVDENRLEQEIAVCLERADISEEITRLKSHIKQFESYMKLNDVVGKRLDFLTQEMFREINTLTVKSQNTTISKHAIEIKHELERIREQVQNII